MPTCPTQPPDFSFSKTRKNSFWDLDALSYFLTKGTFHFNSCNANVNMVNKNDSSTRSFITLLLLTILMKVLLKLRQMRS